MMKSATIKAFNASNSTRGRYSMVAPVCLLAADGHSQRVTEGSFIPVSSVGAAGGQQEPGHREVPVPL